MESDGEERIRVLSDMQCKNSTDKKYNKGGQTLEQVTQKGCEVSILGNIQHLTTQKPWTVWSNFEAECNFKIQSCFLFVWGIGPDDLQSFLST